MSGIRSATSAPTCTPGSSGCSATSSSTPWATTPSACRRAARHRHRHPPRGEHRREHRQHAAQLRRLGLDHDRRRSVATTDEGYYHWTEWIFLQIFNAWYDVEADRADRSSELEAELGRAQRRGRRSWSEARRGRAPGRRRQPAPRLPRRAPVNWCPGLGTILANKEVVRGRSDIGNLPSSLAEHAPVDAAHHRLRGPPAGRPRPPRLARKPHEDRVAQLDRSLEGANVRFPPRRSPKSRSSRPDTLFGATFMVLAPGHLPCQLTAPDDPRRSVG